MELAVPLLALGGLYVASNHDKKKEGYQSMGKKLNSLPNNDIPPVNYPNLAPVKSDNTHKYANPNTVTDRYFKPSIYQEYRNGPDQFGNTTKDNNFVSLTGNTVEKSDFKHNNMAPFFGSKVRGITQNPNISETVLDNMAGLGTQQIRKQEQAPLFAPQKDIRYANGAPNQSDFYQSRVMPGSKMANVKLWEEQRVAPGLDLGYTTEGELGFNSGMGARDKWVDRNVDQLRTATNPKLTFGLANHEGPAYNYIKAPATQETQGAVEKYSPDTYFINTPDRWLTTTGLEKGQTTRSIQVDRDVNRATTNMEYFGADSNPNGTQTYAPGNYEQPKRPQLEPNAITNPNCIGQNGATKGDYGREGYKSYTTNRSLNPAPEMGGINSFVKAAVAPLLDILRPTRKENVVGNCRPNGNAGTTVSNVPVFNPADRTKTTMRETMEGKLDNTHLNVERQRGEGYTVNPQQPTAQERDTTNCEYYGDIGGNASSTGQAVYNAAYNQRNNVNKTYINRPNQGGMSVLNHEQNIQIDKKDEDRYNNRLWVRNSNSSINTTIPSVETYGKINVPQYYDNCMSCERINPDILTAFKQNPYTQSLSSY